MAAIRELLERHASGRFTDKRLAWGAKVSDYRDEIAGVLGRGDTPVLIELTDDLPADAFDRERTIVVDHHGSRAGADRPTSLEQVFALLGRPAGEWTRELALIAANDKGHIAAMRAFGAADEEIRVIRARDRAAQGVKAADEDSARKAIAARRVIGHLTWVVVPQDRSTAVADLIEPALGGPGYDALLVEMPTKLAFFGDGTSVARLAAAVPGSWFGGALPDRGFWGALLPPGADRARLIAALITRLSD
ncbi:MAG: hypothetical protein EA405_08715 [Rhodospirillales bacterium]|nr:MAG: hypothetical protein EA405_08715 [Rhodospirillales bacterium]